jgi:glycine/D-amino acid oxidase-like deaminating enzyme
MFDFAIIGAGSIGIMTALKLLERGSRVVVFLDRESHKQSGTYAAGAMHAVFAELEALDSQEKRDEEIEIGLESRELWLKIEKEYKIPIRMQEDTLLMLKDNPSSFEKNNFDVARNAAISHGVWEDASTSILKNIFGKPKLKCAGFLKGEFGYNPREVVTKLHHLCKDLGCVFVNEGVDSIEKKSEQICLTTQSKIFYAKNVIVSAGAGSEHFARNVGSPIIPMLKSVGAALIVNGSEIRNACSKLPFVVRSVNRGGAQCGFHVVPQNDKGAYIGAGSYVTLPNKESIVRTDTVRYLIDCMKKEVFPNSSVYTSELKILLGNRPKAIDGLPIFGPLDDHENIFFITGNNRIALSLAPLLAEKCVEYFFSNTSSFPQWRPNREPSCPTIDESSCRFYESRVANAIEHGNFEYAREYSLNDAMDIVLKSSRNAQSIYGLKKNFVLQHDSISPFIHE